MSGAFDPLSVFARAHFRKRYKILGSWRRVADEVGMSHPTVMDISNPQKNKRAGQDTAEALAKHLFAGSLAQLHDAAQRYFDEHPDEQQPAHVVEYDQRYGEQLVDVGHILEDEGASREEIKHAVRVAGAPMKNEAPSFETMLERAREAVRQLRAGAKGKLTARPGVDTSDDKQIVVPRRKKPSPKERGRQET